jgi:uncharacterized phiE125 gp8 family phage protein
VPLSLNRTSTGSEPVSVAELRAFARIDTAVEDSLLESLIEAARIYAENVTGLSLVDSTWAYSLDWFPSGDIELPYSPTAAITHIKYDDTDGANQTWGNTLYQLDSVSVPARVGPVEGESYPETQTDTLGAVVVTYTTTWTVPETIKLAIKLLATHWYTIRMPVVSGNAPRHAVPMSVKSLLSGRKVRRFGV